MRQSSLRLRSVRMKATGQTISVLRPRELPAAREGHRRMMRDFDYLVRGTAPGVAGYAIVVWDASGEIWDQLMVLDGNIIPRAMVPSLAKDALQRNLARQEIFEELNAPGDPEAG
jgi:hypothetical protein